MSNLRLSYLQKVGGYLYRPSPHPKRGGGGVDTSPHPPGIYASVYKMIVHAFVIELGRPDY